MMTYEISQQLKRKFKLKVKRLKTIFSHKERRTIANGLFWRKQIIADWIIGIEESGRELDSYDQEKIEKYQKWIQEIDSAMKPFFQSINIDKCFEIEKAEEAAFIEKRKQRESVSA